MRIIYGFSGAGTYEGVGDFVCVMNGADPVLLREILAQLDPDKAEKHWAECLKKGGKPSQSAAPPGRMRSTT